MTLAFATRRSGALVTVDVRVPIVWRLRDLRR
jgi:hypothetical protein